MSDRTSAEARNIEKFHDIAMDADEDPHRRIYARIMKSCVPVFDREIAREMSEMTPGNFAEKLSNLQVGLVAVAAALTSKACMLGLDPQKNRKLIQPVLNDEIDRGIAELEKYLKPQSDMDEMASTKDLLDSVLKNRPREQ